MIDRDDLQPQIAKRARQLFDRVSSTTPSIFNSAWWSGKVMDWCMKNEEFKVEMFRFVDVLPYLNSSSSVAKHLQEYFCREGQDFPSALQWGIRNLSPGSMAAKVAAKSIRANIIKMAKQFITGATPEDALPNIKRIRKDGLAFTLDLLGEATLSWPEADEYQRRYLDLVNTLVRRQGKWVALGDGNPDLDWGISPRVNISVKPSTFNPLMDPVNFEGSIKSTMQRLRPIFRKAKEVGAFINVDVEQYAFKDITLELFMRLMDEDEFKDWDQAGVVIQGYLRDSLEDAKRLISWANGRPNPITVRLVKGAYWDYETVIARQNGWRVPVFEDKAETDANFEAVAAEILSNHDRVRLACASHNLRSISFVLEMSSQLGIPKNEVEYQVLFGMAEPVRIALQEERVPLRVYATVGELIPGMAYLVRRLLENTSNESFLRKSYADHVSIEQLVEDPRRRIPLPDSTPPSEAPTPAPFANEPPADFTCDAIRKKMQAAVDQMRQDLGSTVKLFIDGQWIETKKKQDSINPAHKDQVVAKVCQAGEPEFEKAVQAAQTAFPAWRDTPTEERARVLFRAAELAREKRAELAALQCFEAGKPWKEADADVCEAIDFLDYYGREAIRLDQPIKMGNVPGEVNLYFYQPRGVCSVIAPWNFPLAISLGMTSAALAAGNCVLYKPATLTSRIGAGIAELFEQAGLPKGVLGFLPGPGSIIGEKMVTDPRVHMIAFTGSREVGLRIIANAAVVHPGQEHIKKVVAELGGKNAIIVDSDADLDEAVTGIIYSAFGFQGQKCSACSRVIVLEENYDRFIVRLRERANALKIGDPTDPDTDMGPVIDDAAKEGIVRYIEQGRKDGAELVCRKGPEEGSYAPLTVFENIAPDSLLAQEEIFGPVLSVIKVKDMDEALEVAGGVSYALTGGLYSRSPLNIERALKEFRVGNLYINRGITGAIVGRHAFGGFKMSGIGSKSGGPDYLLQFMEPRATCENTLRRGFAPEE